MEVDAFKNVESGDTRQEGPWVRLFQSIKRREPRHLNIQRLSNGTHKGALALRKSTDATLFSQIFALLLPIQRGLTPEDVSVPRCFPNFKLFKV